MTGTGMLGGVRVLDLTKLLPGPYATMLLGDLGAEVIKVEHPDPTKDMARFQPPFIEGKKARVGALYYQINRNKRSITLDYTKPEGRDILLELVKDARVVVEAFKPGTLDRWGVGREALEAANPDLVLVSVSGFGQSGKLRDAPGHDMTYLGLTGLLAMSGIPASPPVPFPVPFADYIGAVFAALGTVTALYKQQANPGFVHVDAPIFDAVFSMMHLHRCNPVAGRPDFTKGEEVLSGFHPFYRIYRCKDGRHLVLGAIEQKFWHGFCEAIGHPELKDQQFACSPYVAEAIGMVPAADPGAITGLLEGIFLERDMGEWIELLQLHGVCCEPVLDLENAWHHPNVQARGLLVPVDDPRHGGIMDHLGFPLRFNDAPAAISPCPAPGQDNDAILGSLLGMTPDRMRVLKKQRVI